MCQIRSFSSRCISYNCSKPHPYTADMAHYKGAASEGNRAVNLMKKREKAKEELERMKMKISEARNLKNPCFKSCTFV